MGSRYATKEEHQRLEFEAVIMALFFMGLMEKKPPGSPPPADDIPF